MERYVFYPKSVCTKKIEIYYENGIIDHIDFTGGCSGSSKGISVLVRGMKIEDAVQRLQGIQCRNGTSCPDQISIALKELLDGQ